MARRPRFMGGIMFHPAVSLALGGPPELFAFPSVAQLARLVLEKHGGALRSISEALLDDEGHFRGEGLNYKELVCNIGHDVSLVTAYSAPIEEAFLTDVFRATASLVAKGRPDLGSDKVELDFRRALDETVVPCKLLMHWTPVSFKPEEHPTATEILGSDADTSQVLSQGDFLRRVVTAWNHLDRSSGPV